MGLVRRIVFLGVGLAALSAAALPAHAVEATLVADAHVNSARPAVNSGAISNLNVGGGYTALLQFDLSTLPAGTTAVQVSRATLRLYCNRVDTAGLVSVQPISSSWGEYGVTFSTLPSLGATAQVVSVNGAGAYVAVDVTAVVQGWVTSPTTNNGLALTAVTAVVQFDSKENDLTGHAAVLDVALASTGSAGRPDQWDHRAYRIEGRQELPDRLTRWAAGDSRQLRVELSGCLHSRVIYSLHDVVSFAGRAMCR
jgi:hypothetical protein